jgi:hypothetical protein
MYTMHTLCRNASDLETILKTTASVLDLHDLDLDLGCQCRKTTSTVSKTMQDRHHAARG